MYNEKFIEFKEKFLNNPKVYSLMSKLAAEFEQRFREEIIDTWTQEDEDEDENIEESIETIYSMSRDMNPEDFTIFEIFLFKLKL